MGISFITQDTASVKLQAPRGTKTNINSIQGQIIKMVGYSLTAIQSMTHKEAFWLCGQEFSVGGCRPT